MTCEELKNINGGKEEDVIFQPLPGTNFPCTKDAPFVPGVPGYKKNDVPYEATKSSTLSVL
ncbi:TPA: hypothetical protein O7W32_004644 [Salmonella enterica]|nr:hypothetical protein [Salmonella enterica]HDC1927241.1 hypothetical protein [Salmonella enterica]